MKRASLAEVAGLAGVSLTTASRALSPTNDHAVNPETQERVRAAARELKYTVNGLARGLKVRRTQAVAVMVHDICDPYFNAIARGVTDAADPAGYLTVVCNSDRNPETELRYVQLAQEQRVAGIFFVGGGFVSNAYRAGVRRQIAALREYGAHAIALGPRGTRMPAEIPDNTGGARLATEHLIELGHRRIAYIDGPPEIITTRERRAGYRQALEAAGLPYDDAFVIAGGYAEAGGAEAINALLASKRRFTAVFASNDAMAIGCMGALAAAGLRVPEDVSLVGFDDIPVVSRFDPPLTTVSVPMAEIGAAGMRRLLALLEPQRTSRPSGRLVNVHQTRLVVRGSTAPPTPRSRAR
jgi:LacI family transcriptional regulator